MLTVPDLLLARIDSKSPVEYLTREDKKAHPRALARCRPPGPPASFGEIAAARSEERAA